jgi:membrane protein DedA with SNARE-associated domain
VISNLVSIESNSVLETQNRDDVSQPHILFIADPLISDLEIIDKLNLDTNLSLFTVNEESYKENATRAIDHVDSLEFNKYYIVGNGIGGSVAMHLAVLDTTRLASLTLIDANGIEELEILGGYHLNNAIYRVRTLWFKFVKLFTPHFGYFTDLDVKIKRSESQAASDQRLIRDLLKQVSIPVSIIHSPNSRISEAVSIEHHRILPQSELNILADVDWSGTVIDFIDTIETGLGTDRSMVSEFAQQESLKPFDPENGVRAEGTALILLMLVIILSTLISEDLTCIGTGLMIARGLIGFFPGTLACLLGIFLGDILLYLAGRWLASSTLHKAPLKWFISEKDIQLSYHWFEAKGPSIIIASRFIPGTRFPTYFSAGAIGASFGMFMFYFGIASIIWTPILVGLAVILGQEMIEYFSIYQDYALWVLFGVLAILFVLFKIIIPSFTYKGRRLLVGSFKRKDIGNFGHHSLYMLQCFYIVCLFGSNTGVLL